MKNDFCGWYFKCQSERETIALIPAVHTRGGERTGSLQFIGGGETWSAPLPGEACWVGKGRPMARLGESWFSTSGIRLDVRTEGVQAHGTLRFGPFTPLRYDIMGPFALVPGMECRHRVASMAHRVDGTLTVNGRAYRFENGLGYIEGDRGRSFPRRYLWTHSFFQGGSLMLSAADIPLGPLDFTGVIGAVLLGGREIRLATYLGARAQSIGDGTITVRQGELTLTARLLEREAHPLRAPVGGAMERTIRENISCTARYRLWRGDRLLLDVQTDRASFEYEYPQ